MCPSRSSINFLGLADVHGIDGDGNTTFVHLDVNPANIVSIGGTLKLVRSLQFMCVLVLFLFCSHFCDDQHPVTE